MRFKIFVLLNGFQVVFGLSALSQLTKYQQLKNFDDQHTVYQYKKSNWDGTHASTIFLYIADSSRLESFKWAKGDEVATLVSADIDWTLFSVKKFTNYKLKHNNPPTLVAVLKMVGDSKVKVEVSEMRDSLLLTELPWQSYDFDFAGLGFTWRAIKNKRDSFHFHIADAGMVNGNMAFINKGRVQVNFAGYENVNGKECMKFSVNGIGLENKGGTIWINPSNFMIEQYKIALPDEPGFENGMLQLMKTQKMQPKEWEAFKLKCLANE
jgi:hypothetical protein